MQKMCNASGLRGILLAGALVALAHGVLLRTLDPSHPGRGGRPHDGRPHPTLFEQVQRPRSKEDNIREMFEFAQAPTDVRRCLDHLDTSFDSMLKAPLECATSDPSMPRASYIDSAIINSYPDEVVMNGGTMGGVSAYEHVGFGGSEL